MSATTIGNFTWVDVASYGIDESVAFYGKVFGWTLGPVDTNGPGPYGMLELGDDTVAGIGEIPQAQRAMPASWNSYVRVSDCAETVSRATALGAEVVFDTHEVGSGSGKLAYIKDPTGAVIALWEGEVMDGCRGNAPGHFCWQELATRDIDGAKSFYTALFGWEMTEGDGPAPTRMMMISIDGTEIGHALEMTKEWGELPPHWSVYFSVADTDATCESAKEAGGEVAVPPTDIPPGRMAVIQDVHGAPFYIIKLANP